MLDPKKVGAERRRENKNTIITNRRFRTKAEAQLLLYQRLDLDNHGIIIDGDLFLFV